MHHTVKESVENGEMLLHYHFNEGNIESFHLEHRAQQLPTTRPGEIMGKGDKLLAIMRLLDEVKSRHNIVA